MTIDPGSEPKRQSARIARYGGGWAIALSVVLGITAGVGAFTFRYAKGLSYFSREPSACANCHIMQSQYDSWQKSSHHGAAVCIDCHLPHDFIGKYLAKAENGYRHSKEFTAQTFHEPIRVKERGMAILQENCVTCHALLTHEIASGPRGARDELTCVHCHAGVGHGERSGLGGPLPPLSTAKPSPSNR